MQERPDKGEESRFTAAEITLAGYELLRLRRVQWRRLLDGLLGPAFRLNALRSARTRMWRSAFDEIDCHGRLTPPETCCD